MKEGSIKIEHQFNIPCCIINKETKEVISNQPFENTFGITPKDLNELLSFLNNIGVKEISKESIYERDIMLLFLKENENYEIISCKDKENDKIYLFILPQTIDLLLSYHHLIEDRYIHRLLTLGELSSSITHEFKNILTSILGWIELGNITPDNPETIKTVLEVVQRNSERAKELIDALMSFGDKDKEIKEVLPEEILDEVIKLLSWKLRKYGILVTKEYNSLLPVTCNPVYLYHIFLNIILNAIQAMSSKGGEIIITTEKVNESNIKITISDTGPGIDKETLKKIFLPFFSTKTSTESKIRGIGLSLVKKFIDRLNGSLEVKSEVGVGTTFYIYIPRGIKKEKEEKPLYDINLIVMDDEEEIRELFSMMIAPKVNQIAILKSYEELESLLMNPENFYHLAIIDYTMPGIEGKEISKFLRSIFPEIIICFITGRIDISMQEKDNILWIKKPFTLKEIEDLLKKVEDMIK